jgi:hypothetical protein
MGGGLKGRGEEGGAKVGQAGREVGGDKDVGAFDVAILRNGRHTEKETKMSISFRLRATHQVS